MRKLAAVLAVMVFLGGWALSAYVASDASAQGAPTATPGAVILPTSTWTPEPPPPTATRTPTDIGPALIEAKSADTNVRAGPGTDTAQIGKIQPGERYIVRGRRFEWLQIDYPLTPTRVGWVYLGVVNIIGDESKIPELGVDELPTIDPAELDAQGTLIAATLTPGGILALTAQASITPQGIFTTTPDGEQQRRTLAPGEVLPTFTFPPFTNTPIPVEQLQAAPVTVDTGNSSFVPAIPILGLASLGLLGLFVAIFRRL
ncbi:MAG: SH3 domain-containing protein [Anaerolineales bacterium]|nr:SH3 domain-containing protein [Anaerolineales bacterium]